MALHICYTKTLKCCFYRHPCFLLCGKIYSPPCFLSFSMPYFPTLEINLLDEAESNHFSRSRKNMSSLTPFSLLNSERISSSWFFYTQPSFFFFKKNTLWLIFPVNVAQLGLIKIFAFGFGSSGDRLVQSPPQSRVS